MIPREHTINFAYHDDEEDTWYRGSFVVARPTIGKQNRFRLRAISYCDGRYYDPDSPGNGVDSITWLSASVIARLEQCFTSWDAPWFDPAKLNDFHNWEVLFNLWREVVSLDDTIFRGRPKGAAGDSAEQHSESDGRGSVAKVVGGEVPPASNV